MQRKGPAVYLREMRSKLFFGMLVGGIILDGFLLSKPNLLGKIGLVIYKFHYLRTFPRAVLTVTIVISVAVLIAVIVQLLVRKEVIGRNAGRAVMLVLIAGSAGIMIETILTFLSWSAGHTGMRFRAGAYLLPCLLASVFVYYLISLTRITKQFPVSPPLQNGSTDAPQSHGK